ncbi:conserved protein of unknown function [Paraburkholderia kururiensis]
MPKRSVRAATHVRATAVAAVMAKVPRVHAVARLAVVPASLKATARLENNDAATETQEVSQRAEGP